MKKTIAIITIIIIIFSFIPSFSYGKDTSVFDNSVPQDYNDVSEAHTQQDVEQTMQEGSASVNGNQRYISGTESMGVSTAGALARMLTFIPWATSWLMTSLVTMGNTVQNEYSTTPDGPFTIENLVFDRMEVVNNNYFVYNASEANYKVKETVKNWYSGTRVIGIAASIVTLIYMGIRMGLSTVASDKAKYKRMFFDWVVGFAMIFVLHIIIIFASNISTSLTFLFSSAAEEASLERNIMEYNIVQINNGKGWEVVAQATIYTVLVFYQLRFLIMYTKRFLMTGFLIVIAPLISITYALDRAADKKSQIFSSWWKELVVNILIQPLHALLYLVFMYSAGEIAAAAPLFAVAFIMALARGEKIVKGIFNLRGLTSIHSMSETLKPKSETLKLKGG